MFTSILAFKCNTELQNSLFPTKPELYGTFGGKVVPKIALFPSQPVSMVHLVGHWQRGPKIALLTHGGPTQRVQWYIWWATGKMGKH